MIAFRKISNFMAQPEYQFNNRVDTSNDYHHAERKRNQRVGEVNIHRADLRRCSCVGEISEVDQRHIIAL